MITPGYSPTATERVLPRLAIDFTTAIADTRVATARATNTATRTNSSGVIETVNANLPRFDFDPVTLRCLGQIIEEARTNLLLNSLIDGTNLATQSVTLSAVAYTLSFYGSGSVVISGGHSATVDGIGNYPERKTYSFTPSAGSSTFTVSGDVKFAQLEAGAFATSFIATAATSTLRNADVVTMTGTNFSDWYNATEGTISVTLQGLPNSGNSGSRAVCINDTTANNSLMCAFVTSPTTMRSRLVVSGTIQVQFQGSVSPTNKNNICTAYKINDFAASFNSSSVLTDTSSPLWSPTQLAISGDASGSLNVYNGHIKKILYWPQRLTNNEVQAFSK